MRQRGQTRPGHCGPSNLPWHPVAAVLIACLLPACRGDRIVIGGPYDGDAASDALVDGGTALAIASCPSLPGAPAGIAPLPTSKQLALQRLELAAFMHFGVETFDTSATPSASLFNPTNLDANEWAGELKKAGFGQVTLVAKHHSGFCLWPSAYTEYSVKNSPWKDGHGDVVGEFTNAMHAAGLRVGFYVSPSDNSYPSSSPSYEQYLRNLITELLTAYGPVYEIMFPGDNAPKLDWAGIAQLAHQLQPSTIVFMGPEIATTGADARYVGAQFGVAPPSTSSIADVPNGGPSNVWYLAETDFSDRPNGVWFWNASTPVVSLGDLQSVYFTSVGRNATLVVNVPPSTTGQIDGTDLALLHQFASWYGALYQTNLLFGQPIVADSTWARGGFEAAKAIDGDICTYWAADSNKTAGRLEVTPAAPVTFTLISIREPIELGERTTAYHVEIKRNGIWNKAPTDASGATIAGQVIGQRQLWQLNATTADAIALVIDAAKGTPAIAELGVY